SRSELLPIEQEVRSRVIEHFGANRKLHFVAGISGGVDSMVLLHILNRLGISAYAIHINYQKRSDASDEDARLVARTARKMDVKFSTYAIDSEELSEQNFQQWARRYRYEIFEKEVQKKRADGIAVAHHRDDQIETIIQKIFRGGGLASWSGMAVWNGRVFRPLLNVSRDAIERYAEQQHIPFRTDESNLSSDFARNFLRNDWLAKLEDFFPGWEENILRVSKQATLYESALQWIANSITEGEGIGRDQFHTFEPGLQKALILYLLKQKNPDLEVSRGSLEQLGKIEELQTGQSIQLTDEFMLLRDRSQYRFVEPSANVQIARRL